MEQKESTVEVKKKDDKRRKLDTTEETVTPGGFEQQWKRRRRKRIIGIVIAVVVILIVGLFVYQGYRYLQKLNAADTENVSTTTYRVRQAVKGKIETTLSSSGSLAAAKAETLISLYDGEAAEVLVNVGDTVSKGDALVRIASDTLDEERKTLLEELNSVNTSMAGATEYSTSRVVQPGISGIVKDVKGEVGDRIEDVMAQYGYLCLVSTDGRMQVKLETDALKKYDTVTVAVSDTESVAGTVAETADGMASVYISKNTYPVGQTVTVLDAENATVGSGALELVEYVRITADEGVISSVRVTENGQVWPKSTLLVLDSFPHTSKYLSLIEERDAILDQLAELDAAESITAPFDGQIMELNAAADDDVLAGETLLVIQSSAGYTLSLSVDELDITQLAVGQQATVTLDAMDGTFAGVVTNLSYTNSSTSSVARYAVTVTLPDITGALPGMSATCEIVTSSSEEGLTVPVDAVQSVDGQDVVYLAPSDAAFGGEYAEAEIDLSLLTAVPVETGMSDGTTILITGDIANGDLILVPVVTTSAAYEAEEESTSFFGMGGGTGMMPQSGSMPGGSMPDFSDRSFGGATGSRRDDG